MKSKKTYHLLVFTIVFFFLPFYSHGQTISYVDEHTNLIVNGEEFLPMGFYCEALPFEDYPNLAQQIANGGFNYIYAESYYNVPDVNNYIEMYKNFLIDCDNLAIKVVNGLLWQSGSPNRFSQYVDSLKQFPALIAWNIMDDANFMDYNEVVNQRNQILMHDQSRVLSISYASVEPPVPSMMPLTEVAYMQSYPWGMESEGFYLDLSNHLFRNHVLACQENGVFPMATPQTFNWEGETYPSAEHIDVQSYLAFITGMKGIVYYTFKDYDVNSTIDITHPELFAAASKVTDEILNTELKGVILHGEHEYHSIYQHKYYATWRYNNGLYLIAVNTSADDINSYEIPLPNDITGNLINLFPDRPDSLSIQGDLLVGELNPYQVAIYKMETTMDVEDISTNNNLKIAPNPVEDFMVINGDVNHGVIEIYELSGKLVLKTTFENKGEKIDVSNLKSGLYFVKLISGVNNEVFRDFKMIKK